MSAVTDSIMLIEEPYVHELLRANTWLVRGRDRDVLIDSGLGVGSIRALVATLTVRNPLVVLTHSHLDHAGGAHEFEEVWAHTSTVVHPRQAGSLHGPTLAAGLGLEWELPPLMISALPHAGFDPASYRLQPTQCSRYLVDGDQIELGDKSLTVFYLPGHSADSIALFDDQDGTLFSGDVVYDDILLDTITGADTDLYRASMRRLRDLPINVIRPGHGPSFGRDRLHHIIDNYLDGKVQETHNG